MEEKSKKNKKGYTTRHLSFSGFLNRQHFRRSGNKSVDRGASSTPDTERRQAGDIEQSNYRQRFSSETGWGGGEEVNLRLASHSSIASSSRERLYNQPEQFSHKNSLLDGCSNSDVFSPPTSSTTSPLHRPSATAGHFHSQRRISGSTTVSNTSSTFAGQQQYSSPDQPSGSNTDLHKISANLEEYRSLLKVRATSGGAKFYLNYIASQLKELEAQQQQAYQAYEYSEDNYDLPSSSPSATAAIMAHDGPNSVTTSASPRGENSSSRFLSVSGMPAAAAAAAGTLVHQRSNESHDSTNSFLSMASMASTSSGAGCTVVGYSTGTAAEVEASAPSKTDVIEESDETKGKSYWKKAISGLKEKRGSFFKKKKQQEQEIIEVDPVYHLLKCAANQRQTCSLCAGIKSGPIGPTCRKGCIESVHICNVCRCQCHNPNSPTHACTPRETTSLKRIPQANRPNKN